MANKRSVSNIRDFIEDVMTTKADALNGEKVLQGNRGFQQVTSRHGEMIRSLANAITDASQRSSKGGKSGGGMGGQKAGGIKGGGKRKTHFGRKRGPGH